MTVNPIQFCSSTDFLPSFHSFHPLFYYPISSLCFIIPLNRCFQFFIHAGCYDKSKYWCLKFSNYCSHIFVSTSCPKTCGRYSGMLISPLNEKCRMKQVFLLLNEKGKNKRKKKKAHKDKSNHVGKA